MLAYLDRDYGNAGSRTHVWGTEAARAVNKARSQICQIVNAEPADVIFTSGATESNNLALLGLAEHGKKVGKKHIISTRIEHKAVLEPLEYLKNQGFEVELLSPSIDGMVRPADLQTVLRDDTLLVSVMHVNNETGVIQPIAEIAELLQGHETFLHTDAAQGFAKDLHSLRHPRIDLISVSGHKIYGPKGVGTLIVRAASDRRIPLSPLYYGGGQERGFRPGTQPVFLIAAMGEAASLLQNENMAWHKKCSVIKTALLEALRTTGVCINGDQGHALPNTLNFYAEGIDSEALILALKDDFAISNGSACTSDKMTPSHVISAMHPRSDIADWSVRVSWSHLTDMPDFSAFALAIKSLL
jgi:cysteine desulfurase